MRQRKSRREELQLRTASARVALLVGGDIRFAERLDSNGAGAVSDGSRVEARPKLCCAAGRGRRLSKHNEKRLNSNNPNSTDPFLYRTKLDEILTAPLRLESFPQQIRTGGSA
jgi:hypothetical protein